MRTVNKEAPVSKMPRIKITPRGGQKTVSSARKGSKGKKTVVKTTKQKDSRKTTENAQKQTASRSTVSRKKRETASTSSSREAVRVVSEKSSVKRKRVRSIADSDKVREGGEEGTEVKRRRFKEVRISDTTVGKWKPVSLATRNLLSNTMLSALGGCLDGVRGSNKKITEAFLQQIMKRVEDDIAETVAPTTKRIKSSTDLKHRVTELKEKCINLVKKNEEMEQKLEERRLFCDERKRNIQQLEESFQHPTQHHSVAPATPKPSQSASDNDKEDEDMFVDYIQNLMSQTNNSINTTTILSQQNIIF